jgi:hypothetical protein
LTGLARPKLLKKFLTLINSYPANLKNFNLYY